MKEIIGNFPQKFHGDVSFFLSLSATAKLKQSTCQLPHSNNN